MIPVISRKETGLKLRKIMDEKGFTVKRCSTVFGTWKYSKRLSLVKWNQYAYYR